MKPLSPAKPQQAMPAGTMTLPAHASASESMRVMRPIFSVLHGVCRITVSSVLVKRSRSMRKRWMNSMGSCTVKRPASFCFMV